jgi:S1-C subfamily serine protease
MPNSPHETGRTFPDVEAAVVELTRPNGRGVLLPGGFILTAAHCLEWTAEGHMALGDDHLEPIQTAGGQSLLLSVLAVEPVADIAVLGPPDDQRLPEQALSFDRFAVETEPVPLHRREIRRNEPFGVFVLNRDRGWIEATAVALRTNDPGLVLESREPIQGGASGGPVVTAAGELVGVVSWSEDPPVHAPDRTLYGRAACPLTALPVWLVNELRPAGPS